MMHWLIILYWPIMLYWLLRRSTRSAMSGPVGALLEQTTLGEFLAAVENVRKKSQMEVSHWPIRILRIDQSEYCMLIIITNHSSMLLVWGVTLEWAAESQVMHQWGGSRVMAREENRVSWASWWWGDRAVRNSFLLYRTSTAYHKTTIALSKTISNTCTLQKY